MYRLLCTTATVHPSLPHGSARRRWYNKSGSGGASTKLWTPSCMRWLCGEAPRWTSRRRTNLCGRPLWRMARNMCRRIAGTHACQSREWDCSVYVTGAAVKHRFRARRIWTAALQTRRSRHGGESLGHGRKRRKTKHALRRDCANAKLIRPPFLEPNQSQSGRWYFMVSCSLAHNTQCTSMESGGLCRGCSTDWGGPRRSGACGGGGFISSPRGFAQRSPAQRDRCGERRHNDGSEHGLGFFFCVAISLAHL